jgi:predicted nucleotidyltransferase
LSDQPDGDASLVAATAPSELTPVLRDATRALAQESIPHVVFGSIALRALGRTRAGAEDREDVDLFIRPPDAPAARRALAGSGFDVEETDASRLNRATRDDVTVDLVFRTAGDLHLDQEMQDRAVFAPVDGVMASLIPPEDYAVMKAVLYEEHRPYEWFDALSLITRPDLDWPYLVRRAVRHGAQRVLSLLLYARSSGVAVPEDAVAELTRAVED